MVAVLSRPVTVAGTGIAALRPGTTTDVAYDASAATAAISTGGHPIIVRVLCTTAANIVFAAAPTAVVADHMYMPAGVPEYFTMTAGDKVAAIKFTGGTAGVLYVTEMA